jgi:pimeloyl-ACP methyl ester carboxylesterase
MGALEPIRMPTHRRHPARGWLSLVLLLWLGITPAVGEPASRARGELIDVGGHLLYIHCQGEGLPVVVLDAGLGGASSDWRKVQPELAKSNRTCIYDRAGYGRSESGPLPRTSARIAAELRTLLMGAHLPPPYLLVGHSFGGFNVRLFAGLFPDETAGVVLVDSPHEAQIDALFEQGMLGLLDPQGWLRSLWSADLPSSLPAESAAIAELLGMPAKTWYTILNEASAFDASAQELAATPMPADIPVGVLMHGRRIFPEGVIGDGLEQDWLRANRELVRAQRQGNFAIAPQSGHFIHAEQPELIVEMVRKVLEMRSRSN